MIEAIELCPCGKPEAYLPVIEAGMKAM